MFGLAAIAKVYWFNYNWGQNPIKADLISRFAVRQWMTSGCREPRYNILHELSEAYGEDGLALLDFLAVRRTHLNDQNYVDLLVRGRYDEVLAAARRANPE